MQVKPGILCYLYNNMVGIILGNWAQKKYSVDIKEPIGEKQDTQGNVITSGSVIWVELVSILPMFPQSV